MSPKPIPWWTPEFGHRERERLDEVVASTFLNDGKVTERFEIQLAKHLGVEHVVAVTNGTSALFLSLAALGIGPGDEVLVPDITFVATANAVSLTGAVPVLVDVDPVSLNMDPAAAKRALTRRTRALLPVHVSGRAAALKELLLLAKANGLAVVEDAAEALGSRLDGRFLGTWGQAGCFSFTANKIITSGQGGAVATDDKRLYQRLRELKDQGRPRRGTGGADQHVSVGYNFKYTDLQASVALSQLERLPERNRKMRRLYEAYSRRLRGLPGLRLVEFRTKRGETPQWIDALLQDRDGLYDFLLSRRVECRKYWLPVHRQKPYLKPDGRFPNSTRLSSQALWLPSSFQMSEGDVERVCGLVEEYLG